MDNPKTLGVEAYVEYLSGEVYEGRPWRQIGTKVHISMGNVRIFTFETDRVNEYDQWFDEEMVDLALTALYNRLMVGEGKG